MVGLMCRLARASRAASAARGLGHTPASWGAMRGLAGEQGRELESGQRHHKDSQRAPRSPPRSNSQPTQPQARQKRDADILELETLRKYTGKSLAWRFKPYHSGCKVTLVARNETQEVVHKILAEGGAVCVSPGGTYSGVLTLYAGVKSKLGRRDTIASFEEAREFDERVSSTLARLLLPIEFGRVLLHGAPNIFPKAIFPPGTEGLVGDNTATWRKGASNNALPHDELPTGYIPIRHVMGLVSGRHWERVGVRYNQLPFRIFCVPGTYFASPESPWVKAHFSVLKTWMDSSLKLREAKLSFEVGSGCGVISYMLLQHGPPDLKAIASDINPYAVQTIRNTMADQSLGRRLTVLESDLFKAYPPEAKADIIIFNPPWVPALRKGEDKIPSTSTGPESETSAAALRRGKNSSADPPAASQASHETESPHPMLAEMARMSKYIMAASYRPVDLMERFFRDAHMRLADDGQVVVVYTNYAQLVGREGKDHCVAQELRSGGRFTLVRTLVLPTMVPRREAGITQWMGPTLKGFQAEVWVLRKVSPKQVSTS